MTKSNKTAAYIHRHKIHTIEVQNLIDRIIKYLALSGLIIFLILNNGKIFDSLAIIASKSRQMINYNNLDCNPSKQELQQGLLPQRLIINKFGIDMSIKSVNFENGTWQMTPGVINYAIGTSLINMEKGNTGLFSNSIEEVKEMKKGDNIIIRATNKISQKTFLVTYEVESSIKVSKYNYDLFFPSDNSRVTVILSGEKLTEVKHMITAVPVGLKSVNCI